MKRIFENKDKSGGNGPSGFRSLLIVLIALLPVVLFGLAAGVVVDNSRQQIKDAAARRKTDSIAAVRNQIKRDSIAAVEDSILTQKAQVTDQAYRRAVEEQRRLEAEHFIRDFFTECIFTTTDVAAQKALRYLNPTIAPMFIEVWNGSNDPQGAITAIRPAKSLRKNWTTYTVSLRWKNIPTQSTVSIAYNDQTATFSITRLTLDGRILSTENSLP